MSKATIIEADFQAILAILLTDTQNSSVGATKRAEIAALRNRSIRGFRLSVLNENPNTPRLATRARNYSDNHAVVYLILDEYQVRFSMENRDETPQNRPGPGALQVKIQTFLGPSNQSLVNLESRWTAPQIRTLGEAFSVLGGLRCQHFMMSRDGEGCRHWT